MTLTDTFLITGLPRIRSAWLAAIVSNDNVQCVHDAAVSLESIEGFVRFHEMMQPKASGMKKILVGLSDPAAACVYADKAIQLFCESPVVIIDRDPKESRESYERWIGTPTAHWAAIEHNFAIFNDSMPNAVHIPYESLEDYEIVNRICQFCTGHMLNRCRFDTFNLLKIEQHLTKAIGRISHESPN